MVMADKGFTIRDILPEGVTRNIPSFLVNGQFTQEAVNTRLISRVRIQIYIEGYRDVNSMAEGVQDPSIYPTPVHEKCEQNPCV